MNPAECGTKEQEEEGVEPLAVLVVWNVEGRDVCVVRREGRR